MAKFAVFASGRGSNFVAIHQHLQAKQSSHQICALVSDKTNCGAVDYAKEQGIRVINLGYKGRERQQVETELLRELRNDWPDLIVFAGFMRLVSPVLVDAFPQKIINIHPALLPRHPGAHGIQDSYASTDKELGITIHFVDYGMDTGPIILQESFSRLGSESIETIEERIHSLEHTSYPSLVLTMLNAIDQGEK